MSAPDSRTTAEAAEHPRPELLRQPVQRRILQRHVRQTQIQDEHRRKQDRQPHQVHRLGDRHPVLAVADEDDERHQNW
jgi:hypothetical protein